jgi:hypothetical protein
MTPVVGIEGSLVELIAGAKVRGSWWGHPKGREIFRIASALEDDREVLSCKLVGGKLCFVDRALFGPLYRIVSDRGWRAKALARLTPAARSMLEAVPARRGIRVEAIAEARGVKAKALAKPREELERSMLIHSASEHTELGHHATVLSPWSAWARAEVKAEASSLSLDDAIARIASATKGASSPLVARS